MNRSFVGSVVVSGLLAACTGPGVTDRAMVSTATLAAPMTVPRAAAPLVAVSTTVLAVVGPVIGPIDPSDYVRCQAASQPGVLGTPLLLTEEYADRPTLLQSAASIAAPLLVVFHGQNGCIENVQSRSHLDEHASVGLVSILWLSGAALPGRSWNVNGRCCEPASDHGVDDLPYIEAAVTAALSEGLTPGVVVAVGVSNGAAMALAAACAMPDRFAGAVSIGGWMPSPCAPSALSLLVVGGTADDVVGRGSPAIISGYWRTSVVECPHEPVVVASAVVDIATWQGCTGGSMVRRVRLVGVGHVWPKFDFYDMDVEIVRFARGEF